MAKHNVLTEEYMNKIEMKEYKNFKVLCEEIGFKEPKSGNSRKSALSILKENFIYEKKGNKLIFKKKLLKEVKIVKQFANGITLRQEFIELGIIKHILENKNKGKVKNIFSIDTEFTNYFSLTEILLKLGMVNKQYYEVKNNEEQFEKQENGFRKFDELNYSLSHKDSLPDFFKITYRNFSYAIKTALDSLQKKTILNYKRNMILSYTQVKIPYKSYLREMPKDDLAFMLTKKDINPFISKEEALKLYSNEKTRKDMEFTKRYEYCDSEMEARITDFRTEAWNSSVDVFKAHHDKYYPDSPFILQKAVSTFNVKFYGYMTSKFRIDYDAMGTKRYTLGEIYDYFLSKKFNEYFSTVTQNDKEYIYIYEYNYNAYNILTGRHLDRGQEYLMNEIMKRDKKFDKKKLNELTIEKLLTNAENRFANDEDYRNQINKFILYSNDLIDLKNNYTKVSIKNDPFYFNYTTNNKKTGFN